MTGFDWGALMRAGIRGLGLKPAEFWALTPAELMLMLGAGGGSTPMTRARLEELARAFPDHMHKG
ncbi:putative phage protein (TIGR02216 family) [Rhodovulum bhavnagarense]|uniref:Putative phage protein (TIGR02216 family) n=1 Tax=Rhodovulum bhavnagarense TaxID=992286 RepID=A0A4R2RIF4_9RHOB|nr:rcc01693 family protein [Rhodovulum bhavnagarense]TCP61927.1 putative phage protein (TIGR02216 family) [Rhodovulum bhavnagarense]